MSAPLLRVLIREGLAFGGVGAVAFVVQLAVLNVLVRGRVDALAANGIAMIVSCAFAYAGNRWLAFRHRRRSRIAREAGAFVVVNAVTFLIGELVLATAYLDGSESDRLAVNVLSILGIAIGTLIRFWTYRRFVFTHVVGPAPVSG